MAISLTILFDLCKFLCSSPTLPNELLDLRVYGSFLMGLPTPIVTINFGDYFGWASDKSETYVQYVDYMHESLVESCVVSPKLNPETNVKYICLCIFLTFLFLQFLKILIPMFFLRGLLFFFMILAMGLLLLLILLIRVVVNFLLLDLMLLRGLNVNILYTHHY